MTRRDPDPLDGDLLGLFEAERERPAPASDARARVLARVLATVGGPGGGSSGEPSGGESSGGGPGRGEGFSAQGGGSVAEGTLGSAGSSGGVSAAAGSSGGVGAAAGSSGGVAAGLAGGILGKALSIGLAVIALGAVAVVSVQEPAPAATAVAFPPFVAPVLASAPVAEAVPLDPPLAEPPAAAKEDPSILLHRPAPAVTSSSAVGRDTSLAAERAILDSARASIAGGQAAAGSTLLQRHAREFPRGRLAEEREGLWIRALIAAGQAAEARGRFERFRRSYPKSMLLPGFAEALGEEFVTEPGASPQ